MTKRVFYVVQFADPAVQRILDAIRYLSNPAEKGAAHITVRGPYHRRLNDGNVKKVAAIVEGSMISVRGLDTFFGHNQNTVILRCAAESLRKVWMKRDYDYNPHITIYDGPERSVGQDIIDHLAELDLYFQCEADGVSPHISYKGQRTFDLRTAFDAPFISQVLSRPIELNTIDTMDWPQRLALVVDLAKKLPQIAVDALAAKKCRTNPSTAAAVGPRI